MDIIPPAPAQVAIKPALKPEPEVTMQEEHVYHPLSVTISIYMGWLLFWCGALYLLGGYQAMKVLPFEVPMLTELITSPFILIVSLGAFLFLMFAGLHRALKGGVLLGLAFLIIGGVLLWLYGMNVQ